MIEEFNIQGKQTSFYKYCPGTFGYTLAYIVKVCKMHGTHRVRMQELIGSEINNCESLNLLVL